MHKAHLNLGARLLLELYWQTRTLCCGHIVAHDVSWAVQTGKHLLWTLSVSEQNQKHFLCPGHKICVRNKCCVHGQMGKHLCRQQFVRNNVSSFAKLQVAMCGICSFGVKQKYWQINRFGEKRHELADLHTPIHPPLSRISLSS